MLCWPLVHDCGACLGIILSICLCVTGKGTDGPLGRFAFYTLSLGHIKQRPYSVPRTQPVFISSALRRRVTF